MTLIGTKVRRQPDVGVRPAWFQRLWTPMVGAESKVELHEMEFPMRPLHLSGIRPQTPPRGPHSRRGTRDLQQEGGSTSFLRRSARRGDAHKYLATKANKKESLCFLLPKPKPQQMLGREKARFLFMEEGAGDRNEKKTACLLYTSPSPRDLH